MDFCNAIFYLKWQLSAGVFENITKQACIYSGVNFTQDCCIKNPHPPQPLSEEGVISLQDFLRSRIMGLGDHRLLCRWSANDGSRGERLKD